MNGGQKKAVEEIKKFLTKEIKEMEEEE